MLLCQCGPNSLKNLHETRPKRPTRRWCSCLINHWVYKTKLSILTLRYSQPLGSPRWPGEVCGGASRCWRPNPAPGLRPSSRAKPKKQTATNCNNQSRAAAAPLPSSRLPAASHPNLSALDVLRAATDVHGHGHDDLQPGLHCACPPLGHGAHPGQLHLL